VKRLSGPERLWRLREGEWHVLFYRPGQQEGDLMSWRSDRKDAPIG
jgi:hypothetical protein